MPNNSSGTKNPTKLLFTFLDNPLESPPQINIKAKPATARQMEAGRFVFRAKMHTNTEKIVFIVAAIGNLKLIFFLKQRYERNIVPPNDSSYQLIKKAYKRNNSQYKNPHA